MKGTMRVLILAGLILLTTGSVLAGPEVNSGKMAAGEKDGGMLVTPAWVAEHMKQGKLVILHVGDRPGYDAEHIPGAQYADRNEIGMTKDGLILELRPLADYDEWVKKTGISDDTHIVLYFGKDWVTPTTRVYFTLDYLGLAKRTSILDGGLPAWKAEGRPVTTEVPVIARGTYTPRARPEVVVDAAWVNARLHKPEMALVDARNAGFYTGENDGRGDIPRPGHIPGAVSMPFGTLVNDDNKVKEPAALAELFRAAGVKPGQRVVSYCHIGQQATLVYFVAKMLGYDVALYDGSYTEWGARKELPVEGPASKPQKEPEPEPEDAAMYRHHFTRVNDEFSTGGQPPMEELAKLKAAGIRTIINLRPRNEYNDAREEAEAKKLGLRYLNIPVVYDAPREEQVTEFLKLTDDPANRPAFIHCAMAVRVGAFWMIRRVLRDGWSVEKAEQEAEQIGLGAPHLKKFARDYIERHRGKK